MLANEAWNFVHREFPSIKSTEDFLACDLDDICLMVGSDDLNVAQEEEVGWLPSIAKLIAILNILLLLLSEW